MRSVFLGDAHLTPPVGEGHARLTRFLERSDADRLFLMGDLFEFVVGVPGGPAGHAEEILRVLDERAAAGLRVIYLEGNHDFGIAHLVSPSVEVWTGPGAAEQAGLALHLAHGDQVQTRDLGYRALRRLERSSPFLRLVQAVGPDQLQRTGERLAGASRGLKAGRRRSWRQAKLRYVEGRTEEGAGLVVLGHSHQLLGGPVGRGHAVQVGCFDEREQHAVLDGRRLELVSEREIVARVDL